MQGIDLKARVDTETGDVTFYVPLDEIDTLRDKSRARRSARNTPVEAAAMRPGTGSGSVSWTRVVGRWQPMVLFRPTGREIVRRHQAIVVAVFDSFPPRTPGS